MLKALESPSASLRFAALQGLLVITDLLSAGDHGTAQTAKLIRRLWVVKFDVDEENAKVGERYSLDMYPPLSFKIKALQRCKAIFLTVPTDC